MGKKTSSKPSQVLFIVVLLCICIYRTESAVPSHHHHQLSITGRRMMASNRSDNHQKGKTQENIYKPNSEIFTGPSHSGHGGSSIDQVSSP
ncbi:uncharacterized protein LOC17875276 [Capsella rubella]|nr:uncharacterized protein LOC17875276 [Capsella rubella]